MVNEKEETISQQWYDLYTSISLDGFHYIFETTGLRKILWALLFIGMATFSVVLFYGNVNDYVHHKTVTSQEEIFTIEKLEFPTVTICNLNSVSAKKLNQANITSIPQNKLLDFYQKIRDGKLDVEGVDKKVLEILEKEKNVTSLRDIITMFELGIEEMLQDPILNSFVEHPCRFNGGKCKSSDFKSIVSETYGLCHQYHSFDREERIYASSPGSGTGLHLYLNIHEEHMLISRVNYQGLIVFVHPLGTPFESATTKRVPVSPGSITFVHVKVNAMKLLEHPYSTKCSSKPYTYVRSTVPYFQSMCSIDCAIQKMHEQCGCVALEMSHHTDKIQVCSLNQIACIEEVLGNLSRLLRRCRHKCPIECDVINYDIDSAQTIIGNAIVNQKVKPFFNSTEKSIQYIMKNIVGIDVAFADISYTKETVSPATNWSILLGAIGGNLGLCLGCSLVTFVELIVFTLEALYKKIKHKCKPKCKPINAEVLKNMAEMRT